MRIMSGGPCLHFDCTNRNSFGYCKTTACINSHYQQEQWGLPSTSNASDKVTIKPQTNADRIRGMTDKQLAEWGASRQCPSPAYHGNYNCMNLACEDCWLDWLRQEASE